MFEDADVASVQASVDVGYEDGSYYSANKTMGCTCHYSGYNPCEYYIPCDCIVYADSIQCMAFAKYCHSVYNGTMESDMSGIKGDGKSVRLTENNLNSYLKKAGKVIYMSVTEISKKWTMPVRDWGLAYAQFSIYFEDRFVA